MSVVINTNSAATMAANNLAQSSASFQRSLNRLSSGSKIVSPADDAGGLAVSMKLIATTHRQAAVATTLANSTSFLQTQDGVLKVAGQVLNRISELKTLYQDPTKNSSDLANYDSEFTQLRAQLTSLGNEKFNGVALFGTNGINVDLTGEASATTNIGTANLMGVTALTWNSIGQSVSDWSTANGAHNTGSAWVLPGTGEIFTNQSNVTGPLTLTFDATASSTGGNLAFNGGGSGFGGPAVNDTAQHHYVVTDDGTTTTVSVDGSTVQTVNASLGGTGAGGFLGISSNATTFTITNLSLTNTTPSTGNVSSVASASSLSAVNLSTITSALQDVASYRATNGGEQSRLGFATDVLIANKTNLEAANSRITDVDVAEESTQLARYNVLVQAGTAMLSQANQSSQVALKLLG